MIKSYLYLSHLAQLENLREQFLVTITCIKDLKANGDRSALIETIVLPYSRLFFLELDDHLQ